MAGHSLTAAVDTNVLLRLIVEDDEVQAATARAIFDEPCAVSATVLLETGWVLASRYRWTRAEIAEVFARILDMPNVIADPVSLRWAIDRFRLGGDLPDMIHVATAGTSERFVTFDSRILKHAGNGSPIPIETLT